MIADYNQQTSGKSSAGLTKKTNSPDGEQSTLEQDRQTNLTLLTFIHEPEKSYTTTKAKLNPSLIEEKANIANRVDEQSQSRHNFMTARNADMQSRNHDSSQFMQLPQEDGTFPLTDAASSTNTLHIRPGSPFSTEELKRQSTPGLKQIRNQ